MTAVVWLLLLLAVVGLALVAVGGSDRHVTRRATRRAARQARHAARRGRRWTR
ncbi:hypothetical protein [Streptomyces sp. NPDC049881]|uniref:hypothetical protein n=1 Tax=Streptomyces sp. NPDC049881 TaxID=3155778 RepID=UPI003447186C